MQFLLMMNGFGVWDGGNIQMQNLNFLFTTSTFIMKLLSEYNFAKVRRQTVLNWNKTF